MTPPLVSIIMFCRNNASTVERAVLSVLNNGYPNVEFVVQDGQSTDGTVAILRRYSAKIQLVTEPDAGPSDAFIKALNRCTGTIIGSCLADEELIPGAIAAAVEYFADHPMTGTLIGDAVLTDDRGIATGVSKGRDFDLFDYLMGRLTPYFCACFFSHAALRSIGYFTDAIDRECFEFELWTRMATRHRIAYVSQQFAKYAIHDAQLSNTPAAALQHIRARVGAIRRLFSPEGFFGNNPALRDYCLIAQYRMFYAHAITYQLNDVLAELQPAMAALSADGTSSKAAETWIANQNARQIWLRLAGFVPATLKRWILNKGLHLYVRPLVLGVLSRLHGRAPLDPKADGLAIETRAELMMRHQTAMVFHSRGQIDEALRLWRAVEDLGNEEIDSLACQAAQKSPLLAAGDLLVMQERWARRHAPGAHIRPEAAPLQPLGRKPIAVAYHCAWWDSVTAQRQLLNFISRHDRSKVRPLCYSPIPVPPEVARHFDAVRITGRLSNDEFAALAHADGVDVLMETTGFSPDHRYAAMAQRCAPVQISYLNHHATTGVTNLDYVLGDALVAHGPDASFFSEKIYALPGCFFCFDLRGEQIPFNADPPCLRTGQITFGCFGTASKLNLELIALWSRILTRVPDARLFLRNRDLEPTDNHRFMEQRFAQFGVTADRLILKGGTDNDTILRNYAEIDISLDTWPYCGGNTIAESFWQGVPVITLLGDRFSARYGASLVRAHGCPELVANSMDEYVEIAVALAQNPARIAEYRRGARNSATQFGFNDSEGFARRLEDAYKDLVSCVGGTAAHPRPVPCCTSRFGQRSICLCVGPLLAAGIK